MDEPRPEDQPAGDDPQEPSHPAGHDPPDHGNRSDPWWLEEAHFDVGPSDPSSRPAPSGDAFRDAGLVRPPGPGLPESLLWLFGLFVVQIGAAVATVVALIAYYLVTIGPDALRDPDELQERFMPVLIGGVQAGFVLAAVVATRLRLGGAFGRRLPLAPLAWRHWALILLLFLPLALLGGQLYLWASVVWERTLEFAPYLRWLDDQDSMALMQSLADQLAFPVLILVIAVAPAIGEELVFRGVIGRGLVARWGLPMGIALTALLFAAAHVRPPHVFALLPLAVLIHLLHVATRSFWAPVLLHFLNNALAASLVKFPIPFDMPGVSDDEPLPVSVFVAAVLVVLSLGTLIWQTRMRFEHADGTEWDPGYPTVEHPPASEEVVTGFHRPPAWLLVAAVASLMAFGVALGVCASAK